MPAGVERRRPSGLHCGRDGSRVRAGREGVEAHRSRGRGGRRTDGGTGGLRGCLGGHGDGPVLATGLERARIDTCGPLSGREGLTRALAPGRPVRWQRGNEGLGWILDCKSKITRSDDGRFTGEAEDRSVARDTFQRLLPLALAGATDHVASGHETGRTDHGVSHWRRVAANGRLLAGKTPGADVEVVLAFAALHDSQRLNEWSDPGHGPRAAAFASHLHALGLLGLTDEQFKTLERACRIHNGIGTARTDPTVACCLDADRLDLPRVGITPDPARLSTPAARRVARRRNAS